MSTEAEQQYETFDSHATAGSWAMAGGCLLGCAMASGLICLLVLCAGGGTYWWVSGQVEKYTAEQPVELPVVRYSEEQLNELETRIETFVDAIDQGEIPDHDLVLTAEEINALIAQQKEFRGKVFIKINDGQIVGDVSVPTDPIPGGKDRYLNGSATIEASLEGGVLIVTLADAEVNGQPVPSEILDGLSRANLAKELYKDKEVAETMRKFRSLAIEDDKIFLELRRDENTSASSSTGESADQ